MMNHRLLLLIVLLAVVNNVYSQNTYTETTNHKIDSLQLKLDDARIADDTLNMCRAYYKLGQYIERVGEKERSYLLLDSALFFANELGNSRAIAAISNSLAANYSSDGLNEKAIEVFKSAADMFLDIEDTTAYSKVLLNMALEYVELSEFETAMEYELKALRFCELSDSSNICYFIQSISELYYAIGDRAKWKEYLLLSDSLSSNDKYADNYARLEILNEVGGMHMEEENFIAAKDSYSKLYNQSKAIDYKHGMAIALTNLVPVLKKIGSKKTVIGTALKAIKLNEENNRITNVIYGRLQLGKIYREYGEYNNALKNLKIAEKLIIKNNAINDEIDLHKQLYLVYKKTGNNKLALENFEMYSSLNDSLLGIERKKAIDELDAKFQVEKKEQRIEFLNKDNEHKNEQIANQRMLIIVTIIVVLLLAILGYYIARLRKNRVVIESLRSQQKMLISQMNPHFLFNSLTAIQNYLLENDAISSSDYLADFSKLMRLILTGSRNDFIPLRDDIKIANFYLKLQQLRFNNSFKYEVITPSENVCEELKIPPMLSQPFIENAVEHGIKNIKDGKIIVNYSLMNGELKLEINDNGKGFDPNIIENKKDHISYATQITNERIETYNKSNRKKITLSISGKDETEQGTMVRFTIPVKKEEVNV